MPTQVAIIDYINDEIKVKSPGAVPMIVVNIAKAISDNSYLISDHSGKK